MNDSVPRVLGILVYCDCCKAHRQFFIEPMKQDTMNPKPWGDLVCG